MTTSTPKATQEEKTPLSLIASKVKFAESLNLKQFDLMKDDPAIWIAKFEAAAKQHGSLKELGFALLFHLFDENCLVWHFQHRRANPISSWANYKDEFLDEMNKRFLKKLSTLKQKWETSKTYAEYVNEQVETHKSFFPNMTESELILVCLSGLPCSVQTDLNEFKSVSLNAFVNFCAILDKEKAAGN